VPYFRPYLPDKMDDDDVSSDELLKMILRCWSEDPIERPDFSTIKKIIKDIHKLF